MPRTAILMLLGALFVAGLAALLLASFGLRISITRDVPVTLRGPIAIEARLGQPLSVMLDEQVQAKVQLEQLEIPIDQTIEVPLDLQLDVPIDTEIAVSQDMDLSFEVPIDTVLTERELDLS